MVGLDIKERISKVGFDVEMNRYSNNFSKKIISDMVFQIVNNYSQ